MPPEHILRCLLLSAFLVLPSMGAATPHLNVVAAAGIVLQEPVEQLVDHAPTPEQAAIQQAIDAHAYRTALLLIGEQVAADSAARAWEQAQAHPVPATAYMANLTASFNLVGLDLRATSARLAQTEAAGVSPSQAERLLIAAHLLVDAEVDWETAYRYLASEQEPHGFQQEVFRFTLARPVATATILLRAAEIIIEGAQETGSPQLDLAAVAKAVNARGGIPSDWTIPEAGVLHRVARHTWHFMWGQPNATVPQVQENLARADEAMALSAQVGFAGSYAAMARLDAEWWLSRLNDDHAGDGPMLRTLNATLAGAHYEASLLAAAKSNLLPPLAWAGIGVALAATLVGIFSWRRR